MISRTRNMAIKMALGCSALAVIFLSNGIGVYAEDLNETQVTEIQQVQDSTQSNNEFIIDEPVKYYTDIAKVQKHTGFNFKLPSTLVSSKWEGGINYYKLVKLSDTSNAVVMNYDYNEEIPRKMDRYQGGMNLMIFKDNPSKAIQQIENLSYQSAASLNPQYDFKENEKTYGNIKGKQVIVTRIDPSSDGGGSVLRSKYFIWQDDSLYYALNYDSESFYTYDINNIPDNIIVRYNTFMDEDELSKIVNSFKDVNLISEVDYMTSYKEEQLEDEELYSLYIKPEILKIYDKDDLIKADELLKFKAKLPINFSNENIKLKTSAIDCTKVAKREDRQYKLDLFYNNGVEEISYKQDMYASYIYDKCKECSSMKDKGYTVTDEYKNQGISTVESYNVNGITVYKYIISFAADNNYIYYSWKDNDVYNTLEIKYTQGYEDDIAKEFITAKPVE